MPLVKFHDYLNDINKNLNCCAQHCCISQQISCGSVQHADLAKVTVSSNSEMPL